MPESRRSSVWVSWPLDLLVVGITNGGWGPKNQGPPLPASATSHFPFSGNK